MRIILSVGTTKRHIPKYILDPTTPSTPFYEFQSSDRRRLHQSSIHTLYSYIPQEISIMDPNSETQTTDVHDRDLSIDSHPPPVRSKPSRPRNDPVPAVQSAVQPPGESDRVIDGAVFETEQPGPIPQMIYQAPPSLPGLSPRLRGADEGFCRCLCALFIYCNE